MKRNIILLLTLSIIVMLTGCSKKDSVVIYTSMEENRNQALKEMIAKDLPDIDVDIQYLATGNSAAKIKNEGTSVEADIVLDLETSYMTEIEDYLADLSNFDDSIYLDGVNKSNKYYTWTKYTMNLIIDKKYFKEHNLAIPKTYSDLLKPEYKNRQPGHCNIPVLLPDVHKH